MNNKTFYIRYIDKLKITNELVILLIFSENQLLHRLHKMTKFFFIYFDLCKMTYHDVTTHAYSYISQVIK